MKNTAEDKWTMSISELLKKELDNNRYEVECFEKLPYRVFINGYKNGEINKEVMSFETDLLIKEKIDGKEIPRLVIESKYKSMTTHGAITYSNKAKAHKDLHNGLRYGVMIGNSKEKGVPPRLLNHGDNFDFMIVFENDIPTKEEWKVFIDVIKRNLNHSNNLESIINSRHNRNKKRYFCIERDIIYYDKVE